MNFYLEAFKIFFKIGAFTIGGGYAMVPLIEDETCSPLRSRHQASWLSTSLSS